MLFIPLRDVAAAEFGAPGRMVRCRECKRAIKAGSRWAAYQVHVKDPGQKKGRQVVSYVLPIGVPLPGGGMLMTVEMAAQR